SIRTPLRAFGTATEPAASTPMRFSRTTVPVVPAPRMFTPFPELPEITLPDTVVDAAPSTITPSLPLGRGASPVGSVPIRLPDTSVPRVPDPVTRTPAPVFPEMMLPAAPLITVPVANVVIRHQTTKTIVELGVKLKENVGPEYPGSVGSVATRNDL